MIDISDELGGLMKQHREPLRKLRNSIFHLRDDASAIHGFFEKGEDRLSWARELQWAFARFFSDYRVRCEIHYMVHNRTTEMDTRRERPRRRNRGTP